MITNNIKAIFQFIEFLHSNIENFKQFDDIMNNLNLLGQKRDRLNPRKNFADKLKYDEVQVEIKDKFKVIEDNIIQTIKAKVYELNICDLNQPETLWNRNISEIHSLKENFSLETVPEILQQNAKYNEFRVKTSYTYFQDFFFQYLDELLKELFDYFKEIEPSEFENDPLLKLLVEELSQKPTITEKLNYWLEIQENKLKDLERDEQVKIIDVIIKNQIEPICNKIEYGLWQLKHLSKKRFDDIYKLQRIENELTSKDAIGNIKARLSQIDLEEKVYKDYRANNKNFDYTKSYKHDAIYFDSEEKIEKPLHYIIEYFRVVNDFYSTTLFTNYTVNSKAPIVYAKHILLKNYLETKLKELEQSAPLTPNKKPIIANLNKDLNKALEEVPNHVKEAWKIYQSKLSEKRVNSKESDLLTFTAKKIFLDKDRIHYKGTTIKNIRTPLRKDFIKYGFLAGKSDKKATK